MGGLSLGGAAKYTSACSLLGSPGCRSPLGTLPSSPGQVAFLPWFEPGCCCSAGFQLREDGLGGRAGAESQLMHTERAHGQCSRTVFSYACLLENNWN